MEGKYAKLKKATFGGGCFWCTEAIFKRLRGISSITSGYSGGNLQNPTYEQVSSGSSGHAEVIDIEFDPNSISFQQLLEVFFELHDPTTLNKQGADVGTQYRSVIFYHDENQKAVAEDMIRNLTHAKRYSSKIVTELEPFSEFYEAENYHKNYFDSNPNNPYCSLVISPKIDKLLSKFTGLV